MVWKDSVHRNTTVSLSQRVDSRLRRSCDFVDLTRKPLDELIAQVLLLGETLVTLDQSSKDVENRLASLAICYPRKYGQQSTDESWRLVLRRS